VATAGDQARPGQGQGHCLCNPLGSHTMNIAEQNLRLVLQTQEAPPSILVKQAESYNFQSTTAVPLKPNQEPARIHICCVLAVEKLMDKLQLPAPDTKKPPIPPAQYKKLLNQFRMLLAPGEPGTPQKPPRTPQKTPLSASRTPRSTRSTMNFDDLDLVFKEEDQGEEFQTPSKRPPTGARAGSPSPRKSPKKSPKKGSAPTDQLLDSIGVKMGLQRPTIDAAIHAYHQYSELVKDQWGLVFGLFAIVSERAEPKQGSENELRLVRAMGQLVPHVYVDRGEWINWTSKIVTGQTWIMNISQTPEPQPALVGAPGGWGLGVEFVLRENVPKFPTEPAEEPIKDPVWV